MGLLHRETPSWKGFSMDSLKGLEGATHCQGTGFRVSLGWGSGQWGGVLGVGSSCPWALITEGNTQSFGPFTNI